MHKTLSAILFSCLPLQAFSSQLEILSLGEATPYVSYFTAKVTVIENVRGLIYWAEPKREDSASVDAINKYIADSKTTNYMPSPLLFQFRLSGVRKEDDAGTDLTNDGFSKKMNKSINAALEGKAYTVQCFGQYAGTVVPYCDLVDDEGRSPIVSLVRGGLLIPDPELGVSGESQTKLLSTALEAAKADQVGIWQPFHGMFRGLQ